ncbi:hypothetical protein KAH43_03975 [Candidatus Bipolaricaulota bacterium]|nr:hypothetical protein [Candidatus Bipolaricaulota bacterium]
MQQVRHRRVRTLGVAVGIILGLMLAVFADELNQCPAYESASRIATIADIQLSEISGLVASRSQPGILWLHNDSGDEAAVYAIDVQGRTVAEVRLIGIEAVDCEDIAFGPGPSEGDYLYLADIGDNGAARETIRVYRFPEPQIEIREDGQMAQMSVECDVIEAAYPDAPRDAETLLVDPITGDIIIVSKDFIRARVYRLPAALDGVGTLEFLTEVPWGFMTGGDISPGGASILLRGYWHAEIWARSPVGDWWAALASPGCPMPLALEPQGEAIGFSIDEDGYFTISEGVQPPLYLYRTVIGGSSD